MKNQVLKSLSLLIVSSLFFGCSPAPVSQPSPSSKPAETVSTDIQETGFVLFKETDGVSTPVTPDEIEYLELNGKKVLSKEIKILKTNDKLTGNIWFKGSGNYGFPATSENRDILKVKFVNSSEETSIPLYKPGKEGFKIQAITEYSFRLILTTDANGNITGVKGVVDTIVDGTVSGESNTAFEIVGGDFTYYPSNGQAVSSPLSVVIGQAQNLTVKPTTPNDTVAQKVREGSAKTSVDGYIGLWKYDFPGQAPVNLNFRKTGSKRFSVSATLAGKTYTSSGDFPGGESPAASLEVNLSLLGENMSVKIENPSANTLNLTLISGGPEVIAPFKNIPLSMSRVVN